MSDAWRAVLLAAMLRCLTLVIITATFGLSCSKADPKANLPPATGTGAAPMPVLPKIEPDDRAASAAGGRTTGTTYPRQQAELGPNVTGLITKIVAGEAQSVKKGEVVFRQDSRNAQLQLAQAKAQLAGADVNLRATDVEHKRMKSLLEANSVGRAQWEQMDAKFDSAKVMVQQAQVAVQMAEKTLDDTMVRAPFDGVVTSKLKNEGELATTMPPTVVLVLQDQSVLDLRFRLPEHALKSLQVGMPVTAGFDAIGVSREAKIARIMPSVDSKTRTVEVVAEIVNADRALRPGMLAEVTLGADALAVGGGTPTPKAEAAQ